MDAPKLSERLMLLIWVFVSMVAGTPATALDPTRSIVQMYHRAYTRDDGLSGGVHAIMQAPDGYLWIGTNDGLYRFDGARFEHVEHNRLLSRGILAVRMTASGDLWVSYADGGLSRLRKDIVSNYSTTAERAELRAQGFLELPKGGGLWAVGGYGPYRFDGRNWHEMSGPWVPASQGGGLWATEPAHDGTLWAKNGDGVFYCRPGCTRFVAAHGFAGGVMGFTHDREGRVWTSDARAPGHMYAMPNLTGVRGEAIPGPVYGGQISQRIHGRIFLDRDGSLWNINVQHGLLRVRSILAGHVDPAQADAYGALDGLSSDAVTTFYEDREGNIWVGTNNGLDRFRPANVVLERQMPVTVTTYGYNAARAADALFFCASTSEDNSSPDAASRGPLYQARADGSVQLVIPQMELPYAMTAAADGSLWVGLAHGLYKLRNGALAAEAVPASLQGARGLGIAETSDGVLWLSSLGHGLWRRMNGSWSHISGGSDGENRQWILALDARRVLWLVDGRTIARYAEGRLLEIPATDGPNIGAIRTMHADSRGMLFGGEFGLARFDGHRFQTLRSERVPALAVVSGIVEADGQTWIAGQAGIVRFDTKALERALNNPAAASPPYELFDRHDGVPGAIQEGPYISSASTAFPGPDGRIWFLTDRGVVWIDPHHIYRNAIPPPVAISSITTDGRTYASPHDLQLPAGASNLEIDYAALSFVEPARLRFRYKLDGVDNDWVDPGERRQVFYTRLEPGTYKFHMMAANDAGVWNRMGAAVNFTIAPTFVQSIWFKLLVALILVPLVWLAYTLRLRQETARLQGRFNVRIAERERIARELHDTLLQGCQGLLLRFQSIANRVPPGNELRNDIEAALDRADAVLAEGRARVRDLRSSTATGDVAQSLAEAASNIIGGDAPLFCLTVEGEQRALNALVGEEVLRVFEEAVRNVLKHAKAKKIDALLTFAAHALRLTLRDDGVGMVQSKLTSSDGSGHFGLTGMRERAERIGGQFEITSREGRGTEVVMVVPARLAYKKGRRWPFRHRSVALAEKPA